MSSLSPSGSTAISSCAPQSANHRRPSCQRGDSPKAMPVIRVSVTGFTACKTAAGAETHRSTASNLEPRLLQVELALDPAHHLARDLTAVPEPDERLPLGGVDLVHQALIEERALLDAVVVRDLARADLEAPLAELVQPADSLHGALARPIRGLQLIDPVERRASDHQPGAELLVLLLGSILDDAEAADQQRQRQALPHHRDEDQSEGNELDQLAARQLRAGIRVQRQRQRRRQRDGTAHTRPAPDDAVAPAGAARELRGPSVDQPDDEGDDEVPQEADRDHRRADRRRIAD